MHLGFKILRVVIILYWLQGFALAQQAVTIKGVILKKSSSEKLSQALVTNLNSKVMVISDELGGFKINVSVGDTLLITKNNYTPQKVAVLNTSDIVIYMQPVLQLNEVTIKGQTTKQVLNQIVNSYRNKGLYFDGRPPIWVFNPISGSPLTGFHELFGKDAANERRFIRFSKNETEAVEIDKRYTKELVKSTTELQDNEIEKFMIAFRPSYKDIQQWNDYQLIQYIKKTLVDYQEHKDQPEQLLLN